MPPDRKAPMGTSATIRFFTAAVSNLNTVPSVSPSEPWVISAVSQARVHRPVPFRDQFRGTGLEEPHVARRDAPHAGEERAGRGHVAERQVSIDSGRVELARDPGVGEDGFDLGGKDQPAIRCPVVERLLAQPVPSEQEPGTVPDGEREHSIETLGQLHGKEVLGEVHEHLGIAVRAKSMPPAADLVPQGPEVVDLAVEGDANPAVLIGDGRVARLKVDDRQPGLADAAGPGLEDAARVGSTVQEEIELLLDPAGLLPVPDGPGYAAHGNSMVAEDYRTGCEHRRSACYRPLPVSRGPVSAERRQRFVGQAASAARLRPWPL